MCNQSAFWTKNIAQDFYIILQQLSEKFSK